MSSLGSQTLGPKVRGPNTLHKNEGWIEARKRNASIEIQRLFINATSHLISFVLHNGRRQSMQLH